MGSVLLVTLRDPHPATFFRSGVVDALAARIAELGQPAVLCNSALTPRQQRNLQEEWDVPVLDRTEVILAIFARRANTAEGRVQVEMAQLEHLLPRRRVHLGGLRQHAVEVKQARAHTCR